MTLNEALGAAVRAALETDEYAETTQGPPFIVYTLQVSGPTWAVGPMLARIEAQQQVTRLYTVRPVGPEPGQAVEVSPYRAPSEANGPYRQGEES